MGFAALYPSYNSVVFNPTSQLRSRVMIFESHPWKKEMGRYGASLEKWAARPTSSRAEFHIQRAVLLSAFILRKLMENRKVTDVLRDRSVRCTAYPALRPVSDRISTFWGLADVSDDYDLDKPRQLTMNCFDLMSEIMHSYVFKIVIDENDEMVSFLVNSYNKRDDRLIEVDLQQFLRILIAATRDSAGFVAVGFHPSSGRMIADVLARPTKGKKRT